MRIEKTDVGKTLYWEANGRIATVTVQKVGTKYFYIEKDGYPFDRETLLYQDANWPSHKKQLYFSEQHILDEREHAKIRGEVNEFFRGYAGCRQLNLEQLRAILKIINPVT